MVPAFITFEWVLSQFYDFANFGLFQGRFPSYVDGQKTKSAVLHPKMRSNKKVEENKPALKSNFLSKFKWAGFDFEVGYLTEPYRAERCENVEESLRCSGIFRLPWW